MAFDRHVDAQRTKFDLDVIRNLKILDAEEMNEIVQKRKHFATLLATQTKTIQNFHEYIAYERNLARLINQRKPNEADQDIDKLKTSILRRMKSIYDYATGCYPDDKTLWLDYFKFCAFAKFNAVEIVDVMTRILKIHGDKPDVWLRYIDWNRNTAINDANSSKELVTQALRRVPRHEQLHLELMNIVLSQLKQSSSVASNMSVIQEAVVIYDNALNKVPTLSICLKMLEEATKLHPLAEALERHILAAMRKQFLREPLFWHSIAQRELQCQLTYNTDEQMRAISQKPQLKYISCVSTYKTAVELLNTVTMWTFYLDAMQMLQNHDLDEHNRLKQRLLKEAYTAAESAGRMTEPHYLHYILFLKDSGQNPQKITDVISRAIAVFPNATAIWLENMNHHIQHSDAVTVRQVFNQSRKKLGPQAYPIWKLYLLYIMRKFESADECEWLIEKIVMEEHKNFDELKASCLEWNFAKHNMDGVRPFYKRICSTGRPSFEFHQLMAELEATQTEPDLNTWRQALEQMVQSYGRDRIDIWLDYVRFEHQHGDAAKIKEIAARAKAMLTVELADICADELGRFQATIV